MSDTLPVSPWVQTWSALIPSAGRVLDLACGRGRHARYLARLGYRVEAVDRDAAALADLAALDGVHTRCYDLEADPWPYGDETFEGIVVTNYLHRPLFPYLVSALSSQGVLIYETFARGNERYGRPSNPNFLLERAELLKVFGECLRVVAYEDRYVAEPKPAMVQRVCAVALSADLWR